MFKTSTIALVVCAAAASVAPGAQAADIPEPIPVIVVHGWYLRGDIGYSNQRVDELDNALYANFDSVDTVSKDFNAAPFFAAGVGYRWNQWFRTDVTGEYRAKSDFHGVDITHAGVVLDTNNYTAQKSEWVGLVNGYVDVGTWHGVTPFLGVGVGAANVEISNFTDISPANDSVAFGDDHDDWSFAWAVYAGLGFEVTEAFTVELAYRYLDMGDGESGDLVTFDGVNNVDNPMRFNGITSHDVKLGVRYTFW